MASVLKTMILPLNSSWSDQNDKAYAGIGNLADRKKFCFKYNKHVEVSFDWLFIHIKLVY